MKIKTIFCIGAGYGSGPSMTVITQKCSDVKATFVDINDARVNAWNDQDSSKPPICDSGLDSIVVDAVGRNFFSQLLSTRRLMKQTLFLYR